MSKSKLLMIIIISYHWIFLSGKNRVGTICLQAIFLILGIWELGTFTILVSIKYYNNLFQEPISLIGKLYFDLESLIIL